jgi:DNA-binding CsgD family transcriptional regulator
MDKKEKQQVQPLTKRQQELLKITAELTPAQLKEILSQSHISNKKEIDVKF